uniref:uncharacterized protein LOC109965872 n=1 Tax=Monopterus albus TaxID=43700 RepID=UPI0009B44C85|nr:uncharacterized protein LOC109965872 [Monopterus albus]
MKTTRPKMKTWSKFQKLKTTCPKFLKLLAIWGMTICWIEITIQKPAGRGRVRASSVAPGASQQGEQSAGGKRKRKIKHIDSVERVDESAEQQGSAEPVTTEVYMARSTGISWSSHPYKQPPRLAANVISMEPGPTRMAISHVRDIKSAFSEVMPDSILDIILDCTNIEGRRVYGERWKIVDMILLYAYLGLLYLAGVFKSKGESLHSLWSADYGRAIFRATMSLDRFQVISRVIRFDNLEDRASVKHYVLDRVRSSHQGWKQ